MGRSPYSLQNWFQQQYAKFMGGKVVAIDIVLAVGEHRARSCRSVQTQAQVGYEIAPIGVQAQAVTRFDREQHSAGFARHDSRARVEGRQVDQGRALIDVMALIDIAALIIENQAVCANAEEWRDRTDLAPANSNALRTSA